MMPRTFVRIVGIVGIVRIVRVFDIVLRQRAFRASPWEALGIGSENCGHFQYHYEHCWDEEK